MGKEYRTVNIMNRGTIKKNKLTIVALGDLSFARFIGFCRNNVKVGNQFMKSGVSVTRDTRVTKLALLAN